MSIFLYFLSKLINVPKLIPSVNLKYPFLKLFFTIKVNINVAVLSQNIKTKLELLIVNIATILIKKRGSGRIINNIFTNALPNREGFIVDVKNLT